MLTLWIAMSGHAASSALPTVKTGATMWRCSPYRSALGRCDTVSASSRASGWRPNFTPRSLSARSPPRASIHRVRAHSGLLLRRNSAVAMTFSPEAHLASLKSTTPYATGASPRPGRSCRYMRDRAASTNSPKSTSRAGLCAADASSRNQPPVAPSRDTGRRGWPPGVDGAGASFASISSAEGSGECGPSPSPYSARAAYTSAKLTRPSASRSARLKIARSRSGDRDHHSSSVKSGSRPRCAVMPIANADSTRVDVPLTYDRDRASSERGITHGRFGLNERRPFCVQCRKLTIVHGALGP